jgi:hypothetical protein
MHRLRASQSSTRQTLPSWNCCARPGLPKLILTPLTRTRDSSTILTWALLRLITCHTPARTRTIPASQPHPSQRALCLTIPHPLPHPRRPRRRRTTNPHPQRAAMSPTFPLPRLLGSSRVGTSPPVATEPLASSPILRVRITRAPCPRLPSTRLLMNSRLTLPTFIPSLHPSPSSNPRMAPPLPTTCPLSLRSQQRSQSHHHPRSL